MRILKTILRKLYHLIAFLGLIILFVPDVNAATLEGWAKNVDLFTDVNLLSCNAGSCSSGYTLTDEYFYDTGSLVQYGYFASPQHNLGTFGDMILNFHRYNAGILYSHSKYVCFSSNVSINSVDVYTGGYNDTINKVGNLDYHSSLIQTLDNKPFAPGDTFYKCNLFVDLFVAKYDGQNIGSVIRGSTGSTKVYLIGEKYESLGLYSETVKNALSSVISSSGLATATSINQVNTSINQVKQEVTEINNSVDKVDDTLNDSTVDSSDSIINNLKDKIPTNSVISDLLLLPVRFLQNFVNALGSSCSQFNLGFLYGTNLYMPCINIENYLGSGIWTTIDLIISGLFIYALRKKFIEIYENLTNLKNGGNEVD